MEAPSPHSPADLLPKATYNFVVHSLRTFLPAPPTDSPEDAAQRMQDREGKARREAHQEARHLVSLAPRFFSRNSTLL